MFFHDIKKCDQLNGEGLRVTLFVSGCNHYCKGCQNPQTWDYISGTIFRNCDRWELFKELEKDYIKGVTLSGGDPLYPLNLECVAKLCAEIKVNFPEKDIWMYTGYTYEELGEFERMIVDNYVDVLVDGEYKEAEKDLQLKWRGSKNQRVIDIKKTKECDEVVLFCD